MRLHPCLARARAPAGDGCIELFELDTRLRQLAASEAALGQKKHEIRQLDWREGALSTADMAAGLDTSSAAVDKMRGSLLSFLEANVSKMMDLFRAMDTDGDGLLTKTELRKALTSLGFEFSDSRLVATQGDEVDAFFKLMDKDGSGSVDYNELRRVLRRKASPEARAAAEATSRFGGSVDADGQLVTKASTKVAVRKSPSATALPRTLHGVRLGTGGVGGAAGALESKDIVREVASALAKNWAKVSALFSEWDADGDGRLTRRELRKALEVLGLGGGGGGGDAAAPHAAADALFASVDADGSGEITLAELSTAIRGATGHSRPGPGSGLASASLPDLTMGVSPLRRPGQRVARRAPTEWVVDPANFKRPVPLLPEASTAAAPHKPHPFVRPRSVARLPLDLGRSRPPRSPPAVMDPLEWFAKYAMTPSPPRPLALVV